MVKFLKHIKITNTVFLYFFYTTVFSSNAARAQYSQDKVKVQLDRFTQTAISIQILKGNTFSDWGDAIEKMS